MQIKPLTQATRDEVRALAQAAANRDEALDTANVFPIGTDHHAVFTTEYLAQFSALDEMTCGVHILDCPPNDQGRTPAIPEYLAGAGTHDS